MALPTSPEIVIVGAGAAGIGAGIALTRLGVPFVILEAKHRLGGRAYSDARSIGQLFDLGCHWFHDATRNPLRIIAERIGHPFVGHSEDWASRWYVDGRPLTPAQQSDASAEMERAFEASEAAGAAGLDISLAEASGGLREPYGPFVKFVFEAIGSGPAESSSALDTARYEDGVADYAVSGGYGLLIERLGIGLPVRLECPVSAITSAPGGFAIETAAGTLRARAVIVTVSNNVLASGHIKLGPVLPAGLRAAIEDLPCGDCEKIAVELVGDPLPEISDGRSIARHGGDVFSLQVRPFGRQLVTTYLAGEHARRVSARSDAEGGALLADVLAEIYGSKLRSAVGRAVVTRWSRDPHVLGAYSYAKAGRSAARPELIAADLAPFFLAGEAHSLDWFSTAHGAYVSGIETAHKAARFLGHTTPAADPLWLPDALNSPNPPAI